MELNEQEILDNTSDVDGLENILEEIVKRAKEMGLNEQSIASPTVSSSTVDEDEIPVPEKVNIELTNTGEMDPQTARIIRMSQVIGKFASTLALRPIGIEVVDNNPNGWGNSQPVAPAWSDSDNIWFDQDSIGDLTDAEIAWGIFNAQSALLGEKAYV
jgi:hypothetical protein